MSEVKTNKQTTIEVLFDEAGNPVKSVRVPLMRIKWAVIIDGPYHYIWTRDKSGSYGYFRGRAYTVEENKYEQYGS